MENEENIVINPNVSKTVSYYEDIFCDAVSTIVQGHLQGVSFDRTVLCKIADDTQREQGIYIVTENNSTKFEAVSNDTTYRKNQNVYVQIPSGDWNQQKLIVGKKVDTTIEPYTYQKPFFNLIDISKNLISGELGKDGIGLIANEITTIKLPTEEKEKLAWDEDPKQSILLWTYNCTDEKRAVLKNSGQNLSGFSKIGIQASFKTNLNPFYIDGENTPKYVTHGQYGLCLQVYTGQYKTDEQEKEVELFHSFYLNQEDMNGSIYDFNTFFLQEKVFDIENINKITKMKLFFYQTPGTFMDNEGNLSPSTPGGFLNTFIKPNLFVKDLYISLGYDSSSFTGEEKVEIFSQDSPTYSTDFDNNNKNISLRWLHKAPNGDFISVTKEDDIDFELRWYRYKLGAQATDEYSSDNWALLSTQTKDDLIIADADWLIYNDSNIENRKYPEFFSTWLFPNLSVSTEQVKAVIIYNNKAYTSNILKFENGNEVINIPSIEAVQALTLRYSDKGLNGNYQLYGQNNLIIEESQARAVHNFVPYFLTHSQELEGEPEILKTAESVEWTVPVKNTMLIFNDLPQDGEEDEEGNYHFKKGEAPYHLSYRINNYYSPNDTNNTVICKVYKNGILYTALLTPSFGFFNNEKVENRLILNFYDENSAVTIDGDLNKSVKVIATLYDGENKKVDLSNADIKWTWKTKNSDLNEDKDLLEIKLNDNKNECEIFPTADATMKVNYHILQASIENWRGYNLTAYLPIAIRHDDSYVYISGTTRINYSSSGELIDFFKNQYNVYDIEGNMIPTLETNDEDKTQISIDWSSAGLLLEDEDGDGIVQASSDESYYVFNGLINEEKQYTPRIHHSYRSYILPNSNTLIKEESYILQPLKLYVDNTCKYICITAVKKVYDTSTTIPTKIEEQMIWSQPILIEKDLYTPTANNKVWDGSLILDEEENTIYSATVSAGKKEEKGFTGVVLGEHGTDKNNKLIGLYGYKEGNQTFGFKEDGTAFIGGNTGGRLNFDGKESTIQSSSYLTNNTGLKLDFDNGLAEFSWKEIDGEQKGILIDGSASDYPLQIGKGFKVGWSGEVVLGSSLSSVGGVVEGDLRVTGRIISEKSGTEGTNSDIQWAIGADGSSSFNNIIITGGQIANCNVNYNSATQYGTIKSKNFDNTLNKAGWCITSKGEVYLNGRLFPSLDNVGTGQVFTTTDDGYAWTNAPSKKTINLTLSGTVPVLDTNNVRIGSVDLSKLTVEPVEIDTTLSDEEYNITLNITSV